jgi:threonine dehydrogenase-like Zn-dependent dehydrogenase
VIVTGLARDEDRFAVARALGADYTIAVDAEDGPKRIKEITGGKGVNVVVNTARGAQPLQMALDMAADRGTIVLAGFSGEISTHTFPIEETARALSAAGREGDGSAIHVTVVNPDSGF